MGPKTPIPFNGHLSATTDKAQIRAWWRDYPDALVGVNAGKSELVALDIDMDFEEAKDGWFSIGSAELDVPDSFTYKTRRGGDHYIYADPKTVRLNGTQDHVTPDGVKLMDVDRRAGSSYFIAWGDELPADRSVFKQPPEWLLTVAVESEKNPYKGTVDEWLERCPKGEPSPMVLTWIETIPPQFGHDVMIEAQRRLVGWAAEGEPGIPYAMEVFRGAWLAGEWGTDHYRRDWDAGLRGAIEKYGAFPPGPRDVGLGDAYINHVNAMKATGFVDVYTSLPPSGSKEAMRERVAYIASIALGEGLPILAAANIAWTSAAARESIRKHLPEEQAQIEVWNVVIEALAHPISGEGKHIPDAPKEIETDEADTKPKEPKRTVELLSRSERRAAQAIRSSKWGDGYRWWGDHFIDVMHQTHSVLSEPYYRLSRWLVLSLIFGSKAHIQFESGSTVILNFYCIALGPSNSGKSESLEPVREMLREFYGEDDSPDIGGDATSAALTQALIRRDGRTSLFHSDEADSVLLNWGNQKGEFHGMKQRITDVYNGRVPAIQRAMQKDISGIHARAYLSVHLIGIDDKITDAVDPDDWVSGFINRFVWAKGDRKFRTDEMRRLRIRKPNSRPGSQGQTNFYAEWAAKFRITAATLDRESGGTPGPALLDLSDDVIDRHIETGKTLEAIALHSGNYVSRVDPTFRRFDVYVLKCAALVAISEGRTTIQMSDYLIALEQVEEWAENALEMVKRTDLSPRARMVNRLAELIRTEGGRMTKSAIYREEAYAGHSRSVDELVKELVAQRRAEEIMPQVKGGEILVRLIEAPQKEAA